MRALILYGPPASGKDTITDALIRLSGNYELFRRLKVGGGRTRTYRMTTSERIAELDANDEILWRNSRYDATYVVDRPELSEMLNANKTPVLHLGQAEAINAIRSSMSEVCWTTVELWCPRPIAEARIRARQTNDTSARLVAWDATERIDPACVDLRIDTAELSPTASAATIHHTVESKCSSM
ncbi:kinase [Nocardia sp. NPDC005825]|uniref:kinase n=1 Tax=unclassified Nocardia TaxID=2637762 RepID=UPI0033E82BAE